MSESKPAPVEGMQPDALISVRRGTHGEWARQSATEQQLKDVMRGGAAWGDMTASQRSAVEMIAVKLSRIVNGDPAYADHWQDIAGYSRLGEQGGHDAAAVTESWVGHTH